MRPTCGLDARFLRQGHRLDEAVLPTSSPASAEPRPSPPRASPHAPLLLRGVCGAHGK